MKKLIISILVTIIVKPNNTITKKDKIEDNSNKNKQYIKYNKSSILENNKEIPNNKRRRILEGGKGSVEDDSFSVEVVKKK